MTTTRANGKVNRWGETWAEAYTRVGDEFPSTRQEWAADMPPAGLLRLIGALAPRPPQARRGHPDPPTPDEINGVVRTVFRDGLGVGGGQPPAKEFTSQPFAPAFRELTGVRTLNQISHRTGIAAHGDANKGFPRWRVYRLLNGEYAPTVDEMRVIARAFGKEPLYFREYRIHMIISAVVGLLDRDPERSAAIARELEAIG